MADLTAREAKAERATPKLYENVTSPFDGMLNDDITVERRGDTLKVLKGACAKSVAGFERKLPKAPPAVRGKPVEFAVAIKEAARLIGEAELPLFGGLATDVEGMRAALAVAERAGGIVDHALSSAIYRNLKVMQISGWITSTLTETRNRADLIIVVGDVPKLHPRFMERIVEPPASMFDVTAKKRTIVFLGKGGEASSGSRAGETVTLPCRIEQAGEVIGAVRARLRGFRIKARKIAGISLEEIDALAERCKKATYGVIVWAPPALDFPHAELTVDQLAGLAKDLNQTIRFAGLALGGAEGAVTASATTTWITGYPLRVSFASGAPDYDPYRYDIGRMLTDGEGDLLVWTASFSPDLAPPKTKLPTVVLGTPGLKLAKPADVFIPIGTPGVDHAGRLVRVDNVVSLPLQDLGRADLPSAASVLTAIEAAL
jgi:formylmethanofuran dehydrogenase subunit B